MGNDDDFVGTGFTMDNNKQHAGAAGVQCNSQSRYNGSVSSNGGDKPVHANVDRAGTGTSKCDGVRARHGSGVGMDEGTGAGYLY